MMKRVMLVEDEEFILQGILCIVDWPSINMELAYTAHNGMEALEKAGKKQAFWRDSHRAWICKRD